MADLSDKELLDELGVEVEEKKKAKLTPLQERVIAGFEDIQRFVEEHGHAPEHGEDKDIFERIYAVRLERLLSSADFVELLAEYDHQDLLAGAPVEGMANHPEEISDEELLSELGVEEVRSDLTELKHVRPRSEIKAAEEIANREPCSDYAKFQPLFDGVQQDLVNGERETRRFAKNADIKIGEFFILNGQKAYVANIGDEFTTEYGKKDRRLRVIYDNKTESNILLRSFQRALYKDDNGRRISDPAAGPLFSDLVADGDTLSGTIYIARTKSDDPNLEGMKDVLHKIGVTKGKAENRIKNAKNDPTFLLSDAELVAFYELYNIDRFKLEHLLQNFFSEAQLDVKIADRFGKKVQPKEWFVVPFPVIDEAVKRLMDGSILNYFYDTKTAQLIMKPQ